MRRLVFLLSVLAAAAAAAPAHACEIIIDTYPPRPLDVEALSPSATTVVSGRIVAAELVRTFEPWDTPGGQVWQVEIAPRPLDAGIPQPTSLDWIINPCGWPMPAPVVGRSVDLLLAREGDGWTALRTISSRDVQRYVAWRSQP